MFNAWFEGTDETSEFRGGNEDDYTVAVLALQNGSTFLIKNTVPTTRFSGNFAERAQVVAIQFTTDFFQEIDISNFPLLTVIDGLELCTNLESFYVENCPKLNDCDTFANGIELITYGIKNTSLTEETIPTPPSTFPSVLFVVEDNPYLPPEWDTSINGERDVYNAIRIAHHAEAAPAVAIPPTKEHIQIPFSEGLLCFDAVEQEDVPLLVALTSSAHNIIFKVTAGETSTYNCLPMRGLEDKKIFYECKRELDGAARQNDVFMETPLTFITLGSGTFYVPLKETEMFQYVSIFEITETTKTIPFLASAGSIFVDGSYDTALDGTRINVVSRDHCQKDTQKKLYTLNPIEFVGPEAAVDTRPFTPYVPRIFPPTAHAEQAESGTEWEEEEEEHEEVEEEYLLGHVDVVPQPGYPPITERTTFYAETSEENSYYIDASRYGYGSFYSITHWPMDMRPHTTILFLNASGVNRNLFMDVVFPSYIEKIAFASCQNMPDKFTPPMNGFPPTLKSFLVDNREKIQDYAPRVPQPTATDHDSTGYVSVPIGRAILFDETSPNVFTLDANTSVLSAVEKWPQSTRENVEYIFKNARGIPVTFFDKNPVPEGTRKLTFDSCGFVGGTSIFNLHLLKKPLPDSLDSIMISGHEVIQYYKGGVIRGGKHRSTPSHKRIHRTPRVRPNKIGQTRRFQKYHGL